MCPEETVIPVKATNELGVQFKVDNKTKRLSHNQFWPKICKKING
jgi:hypothetical protein